MFVVVEVCDVNPAAALDLESLEDEYPGVSVILNPCLSQCATCATMPFVYVNGEILANENRETLLQEVKAVIEQELRDLDSNM
jgi:uncharacterized protein YuzB (UPF0349 family)